MRPVDVHPDGYAPTSLGQACFAEQEEASFQILG